MAARRGEGTARRRPALVLLALLPLAVVLSLLSGPTTPAQAANAPDFNPGNIIADSVFFNSQTMSEYGIQAFLEAKNPQCTAGFTCLRDFYENTWNRGADAQCGEYAGAGGERASRIIHKVAQACGVNPMVLLVLLQKETSLVTKTNPTWDNAYKKATGYGCPDTAPCDAQFYGFYNQVYKAAWQYKRYTNNPNSYSYRAGRDNYIQWNPNANCGGSTVYIHTRATAALYIYTPYQPNAAAMRNLYGTGDGCSAYGNRNFWRMFTDWFGSTQVSFSVTGAISGAYDANGAGSGPLGDAVGNQYPTPGGGLTQAFQNGRIHWSPTTGAHAVMNPLAAKYDSWGGESGALGYPIAGRYPTRNDGWTQPFERGRIHYSPATGAHPVIGQIGATYDSVGGESGFLGYPTTDQYPTPNGGSTQAFQSGRIHWSPTTGAHVVNGVFSPVYDGLGGESGPLGYPVSPQYATAGGGVTQAFQSGRIHWSPTTGARAVIGPISQAYDAVRGESGALGYPTTDRYRTAGDGWTQAFQNGRIHYSPTTGAHPVIGALSAAYDARQGESGALGYPIAGQYATTARGVAQVFEKGTLVISSGGAIRTVEGDLGARYSAAGGASGVLGEPTGARRAVADGASQTFQNGVILDGPDTGAQSVWGPLLSAYDALGGPTGSLGWPTGEQATSRTGSTVQQFEEGALVLTSSGPRTVRGAIATRWTALDGASGPLGDPTAEQSALAAGGQSQTFAGGLVLAGTTGPARAVLGDIATAYTASGGPTGPLGMPAMERYATPGDGWTQPFANGRIHSSPATGAHAVLAPLAAVYDAQRGESGPLGYPVGDRAATPGSGWSQEFQNGRIAYSASTGAQPVLGSIAGAYAAAGGPAGDLGYPTAERYPTKDSGWTQSFQKGRIHYSPATGAHAVVGELSKAYDRLFGETSALGYPVTGRYATANSGFTQAFQHGRIHWSPATGARAVIGEVSAVYDTVRGESGPLGYPIGDRYPTAGNGWTQAFQKGRIHWSPATGGFPVLAPISAAYDALLGESGRLGYPMSSAYATKDSGLTQAFRNGRIHHSPATGAHAVIGDLSRAYDGSGGEGGPLGYPTSGERVTGDVRTQSFQHGTIAQTGSNAPVVTVR
ncbi:LGFP repeat-containing protein [Geodermatophilus sp. CPCC 206100]|uniref:LGFP repeat-containing protein n=1 Tax=Geodermatophilus sp. CPCC 206100 TaxID=3020054 RepID=UPI003B00BBA4